MFDAVQIFQILYLPVLLAHFVLVVSLSFHFRKKIVKPFSKINRKILILLFLIFLFGLYLRLSMSGRYGLDDLLWEHVRNAEAFYRELRFTNFAHPGGHSLLVAISFLFGQNIENASILTIFLDSLSILMIFFIAFLLFRRTEISIFASLAFAILPWQIFISGMGLDVTSSLFFVLLSIVVLLVSRELKSAKLLMLSLLLLVWSAQIRVENLIYLSIFLFVYFRTKYQIRTQKLFILLLAFFSIPMLVWLAYSPLMFGTESSVEGVGQQNFLSIQNLLTNYQDFIIPHFFANEYGNYYPLFIFPMMILGIAYLILFSKRREALYCLLIWFLCWSLVYGTFWYGSQIYRYSISLHPVLVIISACGAFLILQQLREITKRKAVILSAWGLLFAFMIFSTFSIQTLAKPSPITFWPSVKEFAAIGGKLENDACILLQRLKYGRFENAKHLIDGQRVFIEWPVNDSLFSYNCTSIYYFDLKRYAHPRPEDLQIYDDNQASLFKEYQLENVLKEEPLGVYKVVKKIGWWAQGPTETI